MLPLKLILVEFLQQDLFRRYRSELFPFIQGALKAMSHPVRWVCQGITVDPQSSDKYIRES